MHTLNMSCVLELSPHLSFLKHLYTFFKAFKPFLNASFAILARDDKLHLDMNSLSLFQCVLTNFSDSFLFFWIINSN